MDARNKAGKFVVLSALIYLAVLGVTGELHLSSRALRFFAILWLVQASHALWQAWRHPQSVTSSGTSATGDVPPAG
jgi:hypothetical protein